MALRAKLLRRSSRGRTRTCDPFTRNGQGIVPASGKANSWRVGNPDANPETRPNRTRQTVPEPHRAKRRETSESHRSSPPGNLLLGQKEVQLPASNLPTLRGSLDKYAGTLRHPRGADPWPVALIPFSHAQRH